MIIDNKTVDLSITTEELSFLVEVLSKLPNASNSFKLFTKLVEINQRYNAEVLPE